MRGLLQVSLGGEAAGGIAASFDACLALPQATSDVTLQVQDLLVSGGAVSLGRSLFCCFGVSCVGVVTAIFVATSMIGSWLIETCCRSASSPHLRIFPLMCLLPALPGPGLPLPVPG